MEEKIKPELNGAAETMLQSFYARAQYSLSRKHKFYDAKAVEMVEKLIMISARLPKIQQWEAG